MPAELSGKSSEQMVIPEHEGPQPFGPLVLAEALVWIGDGMQTGPAESHQ